MPTSFAMRESVIDPGRMEIAGEGRTWGCDGAFHAHRDSDSTGGAMSEGPDQIVRSIWYCEYRAADAEHPEERDQFLILAQELRKSAAEDDTRFAVEMPKRPAPSVRRDVAARRRA